ncbi:hypothetical protein N7474_009479 [Penicillium riverlandense]|uniref:uncharacterized protein n=1 Tax=Penicillium riverlandense TaxID=1903569 RepID=UPI0025473499|nr:uncharacterized protein N7474_009479 [Penicillium riverlandense]KAJ5808210.1 hypothetical protein N7474_009479 [Penicillium riverlandense]
MPDNLARDKENQSVTSAALRQPSLSRAHTQTQTMNFAPYQDESPEIERALSPPHGDGAKSPNGRASADLPPPSHFAAGTGHTGFGRDVEGGHVSLGAFETSLPIRMDVEAMLAYLLLPPAGGVFLLLTEHKSDYVRYVPVLEEEEGELERI